MDFLIGKVGFEAKSVTSYPVLIGRSLESVLISRYNVLSALKTKGLKIKCSLFSACLMSKERFYERYVVPFEMEVPGLGQAYIALLSRK
jgi:mTERF